MIISRQLNRSRNACLNRAYRNATILKAHLDPERRPDNLEAWNVLFAAVRDAAQDVLQGVHEASAYNNVIQNSTAPASLKEPA